MSIKPSLNHRRVIYIIFSLLWASGIIYLLDRYFNNALFKAESPRTPLQVAAIEAHAAISFLSLVILGSLAEHVRRAWPTNRSRFSGILIIFCFLILVITSWGLYYFGDDLLRNQTVILHSLLGLIFPLVFLIHIKK